MQTRAASCHVSPSLAGSTQWNVLYFLVSAWINIGRDEVHIVAVDKLRSPVRRALYVLM